MSKVCPKCGAENKDNAVICNSCFNFFDKNIDNTTDKVTKKRSDKFEKIMKDTGDIYKEYVIGLKENIKQDDTDIDDTKERLKKTLEETKEVFDDEKEKEKINRILEEVKNISPIKESQNDNNETESDKIILEDNNKQESETNEPYVKEDEKIDDNRTEINKNNKDEYEDVIDEVVSAEYQEENKTHEVNNQKEDRVLIDNTKIEFPEDEEDKKQPSKEETIGTKTLKLKNKEKVINDTEIENADKDDEYEKAINVFETLSNKKNKIISSNTKTSNIQKEKDFGKQSVNRNDNDLNSRKKYKKPKSALTMDKIIKNAIVISLVLLFVLGIIFFIGKRNQRRTLEESVTVLNSDKKSSYMEIYNSLLSKGFSSIEIEEALSKSGIDFSENALNSAYECAKDTNKLNNKQDIKTTLENKQFFENEVSFALQSIDWYKYLTVFVDECILKTKELNKNTIMTMIKEANFSEDIITKIEKYEAWPKLAEKNILSYINDKKVGKASALEYLSSLEYSPEEIEEASKKIDWKSIAKNYLSNTIKTDVNIEASRNSFKTLLESAGFDEEEINAVLDKEDFSSYAKEELNDFISTNEDAINKKDILKRFIDKGFNDSEVNEAMKRVDWNSMSLTAIKTYDDGTRSLKQLLDKLRDLGYSEEEIEYANTNYNWDTHTIYYIKNLIEEGKAGGKNNVIQLLTANNYPLAMINSSIKNFDFNLEALKTLNNYISKAENCSKNKAKEYLQELKYDTAEIDYAMESNTINWSSKAINFLNYVGYDSRVSAKSVLEAQGFSDSEISNINASLESNGNWKSICLTRLNSLLSDKDTAALCLEHSCFDSKNGGTYSALKNEQFTDEEINYAKSQINWPTNCEVDAS